MLPPEPVLTPTCAGLEPMSWWKIGMVSLVENQIGEVLLLPLFPSLTQTPVDEHLFCA